MTAKFLNSISDFKNIGTGLGFIRLCAFVMVGHYFERRRALATGIVACGSGVGMFVVPPLSVTLLNSYRWQGALWVTSGIALHTAVCGSLYRPLKRKEKEPQNTKLMDWNLFKRRDFLIITLSQCLLVLGKYGKN